MRFESPQKHPALPVNVAAEYVFFSVESATESVDLLLEILATCADAPKPGLAEAWARDAVAPIKRLTDIRAAELHRRNQQHTGGIAWVRLHRQTDDKD